MNMKMTSLVLTLIAVLASPLFADVIYREDFDGGATSLDGKVPTVQPSGSSETWFASGSFNRDGTVTDAAYRAAYLPFIPESGNVYKMTVSLSVSSGSLAFGFSDKADPNVNDSPNSANAHAWATLAADGEVTTWTGRGANGDLAVFDTGATGVVTFEITLDASDADAANWTAAWSLTDGTTTWTQSPTAAASYSYGDIHNLALFTREGAGLIDYVQLETVVPEPATMTLLALGAAAMLRRRRR